MTASDPNVKPLSVVIIGAGVAGLAVAYGLTQPDMSHRFKVRILEKRSEKSCLDAGYPIHLSPSGHEAIKALLTPSDQHLLFLARQSMGARHDGISFYNQNCKRIWHTLREPFESSMVERGDLLSILRPKVQAIEYDRKVVSVKENSGGGAMVLMSDGEMVHADLLIGSDGMFSAIRKSLHPIYNFHPMPWVTCNFRLSDSVVQEIGADPLGINVFYGAGFSAAVMPVAEGCYVAITLPSPIQDITSALALLPDSPLTRAILADKNIADGHAFPLYSATRTVVGRGRMVLIGDAAHGMNPFCGAGASMALHDAAELVKLLTENEDIEPALRKFNRDLKKTADPMIRLSKFLLWLAQGETGFDRLVRRAAFRTIELVERLLPTRRRMRMELSRALADEVKVLDPVN